MDDGNDDDTANRADRGGSLAPSAATGNLGSGEGKDGTDGGDGTMTVRVLDVGGQFHPLRVRPETSVRELKQLLIEETGVEFARQRIIYGGKVNHCCCSQSRAA